MLLGSGELGKEVVISAQRLGCTIIAVDRYSNAPAMQVADHKEVINMLDENELKNCIKKHNPDLVVPEIEAIRTEVLLELEQEGRTIIPTARAANLTMNRDRIRDLAKSIGLPTAKYEYAETMEEFTDAVKNIGLPCVVKPVMSSSGKGQSTLRTMDDIQNSWDYAISGARGDRVRFFLVSGSNMTVARNGKLINSDASDLTVTTEDAAFELVFNNDTYGWRIFTI